MRWLGTLTIRQRWQTLLSVDDMLGSIMDKLDDTGVANNTYIW